MDIGKLKRWNELKDEKKTLEDSLKAVNGELTELDSEIQIEFIDAGVQSMNIDGQTVYMSSTVRAQKAPVEEGETPISGDQVCEALGAAGQFDLVKETYNANTVSAWMRELADDHGNVALPPELDGILIAVPVTSIRRRKS